MTTDNGVDDAYRPTPQDSPLRLTVDGEVFLVTISEDGSCSYDWRSVPYRNYGFGSDPVRVADSPAMAAELLAHPYRHTLAQHRDSIADFLSNINPETGYLDQRSVRAA